MKIMMKLLCFVVISLLICISAENAHDNIRTHRTGHLSETHARSRVKMLIRKMTEEQTVEVLAHLWNRGSGSQRLEMVTALFNGFPPARLTSTAELMKLHHPLDSITEQTQSFIEEFDNSGITEKEKLVDLETHAWPKISGNARHELVQFLQLSSTEIEYLHSVIKALSSPPPPQFNANAVQISGSWFSLCGHCQYEAPFCAPYQSKNVCVKKCKGDEECYQFIDAVNRRSYPGKCLPTFHVCDGFVWADAVNGSTRGVVSLISLVVVVLLVLFQ